jgi:hypothetical protein
MILKAERSNLRIIANITGDSCSRWQMLHYIVIRQSRLGDVGSLAYFTLVWFVTLWPMSEHVGAEHELKVETSTTSIAPTATNTYIKGSITHLKLNSYHLYLWNPRCWFRWRIRWLRLLKDLPQ